MNEYNVIVYFAIMVDGKSVGVTAEVLIKDTSDLNAAKKVYDAFKSPVEVEDMEVTKIEKIQ